MEKFYIVHIIFDAVTLSLSFSSTLIFPSLYSFLIFSFISSFSLTYFFSVALRCILHTRKKEGAKLFQENVLKKSDKNNQNSLRLFGRHSVLLVFECIPQLKWIKFGKVNEIFIWKNGHFVCMLFAFLKKLTIFSPSSYS